MLKNVRKMIGQKYSIFKKTWNRGTRAKDFLTFSNILHFFVKEMLKTDNVKMFKM